RSWIHVLVHFGHDEQQLALEAIRIVYVRRGAIFLAERPAHPLFIPPNLVHPIVVAAAVGNRDLVKLRMEEQPAERVLSSGRGAEDADAGDVVVWIFRGDG